MSVIPWNKPPQTPWTAEQKKYRAAERHEQLLDRTVRRSDKSIEEGVAQLRKLIAGCKDLIVQLVWTLESDGKFAIEQPCITVNGQLNAPSASEAKRIMLGKDGLHYQAPDKWGMRGPGIYVKIFPEFYPVIVRNFQLFPDDLAEILKLIQMP